MYRTKHSRIKKTSCLYKYFSNITSDASALYNRADYIMRQYATAMQAFSEMKPLYSNQMEVYNLVRSTLAGTKYFPKGRWLSYHSLDYLLKRTKDPAYYALPAQVNQQVLKGLIRDYTSYFEALETYKSSQELFTGKPKLPGYSRSPKTAVFTNQVSHIKTDAAGHTVLAFPLTQDAFRITDIPNDATLKEVHVTPSGKGFKLGIVYDVPDKGIDVGNHKTDIAMLKKFGKHKDASDLRVISIDPGVDNLCTLTNNFGKQPLIISGKVLKSINQFYNKQMAKYRSIAMILNNRRSTNRMRSITDKRNLRIHDLLHKASRMITDYAVDNKVDVVILGHNVFQKQNIRIGKTNGQNFVQLPYSTLSFMLRYKLSEQGILFVETEESYTSKADFIAGDKIPVFSKDRQGTYRFSGRRIKRGLYRHSDGTVTNADVNGSGNIMRKVFPEVTRWDRGIVDMPCKKVTLTA